MMIRVLLFSDDRKLQPLLSAALSRDYHVFAEADPDLLKPLLRKTPFDVVLLDIDTDRFSAARYGAIFDEISDGPAVVLMVDDSGRSIAMDLVDRGANCYCRKPPAMRELKAIVRRAWEYTVMKRELSCKTPFPEAVPEEQALGCDALIGSSPAMRAVYDLIQRVAPLNASVLVTGESGTG